MSSHHLIRTESEEKEVRQRAFAPVVIIGNGPVGMKAAKLLLNKGIDTEIIIFGEELHTPYNRVQLSLFLAGQIPEEALNNSFDASDSVGFTERLGRKVVDIDVKNHIIKDESGFSSQYSKLILATGSRPFIPPIDNTHLRGVHRFRTLEDTQALIAEKEKSKNIYVLGAGPLGLETAIAMKQPNNTVYLEARSSLLNPLLGDQAQTVLSDFVNASGIKIINRNPLAKINGNFKVEEVELKDGTVLNCDCLIFCAGVVPNTELAQQAGLDVRKGIVVDQYMRTSNPDIYAIGECCEYEYQTYGVVAPGFKQAKSCIEHINGSFCEFANETQNIQVKFGDYSTSYFGEISVDQGLVFTYVNRLKGIYRKIVVLDNRIVGAIIIGWWEEESRIKTAIIEKHKIKLKQFSSFEENGVLFSKQQDMSVKSRPKDYIICLCESVTRGELQSSIETGCRTIECLGKSTKAGTVCGSCRPLLGELLDTPAPNLVMRHQKSIYYASVISIFLIALTLVFKPLSINDTVQVSWHIEMLWFDNFWKQVSGYSLLGLCVIASFLAVRKRFKKFNIGHVDSWRYAHSIVGVLAVLILMVHTGMRLGENLNFALMSIFLAATVTGSLVGIFMAKNHHWSDHKLMRHRLWWSRVHHTLLWMLPPLLGFHILSAYYF